MKIYLAAPYSDKNSKVINERVKIINKRAAELMNKGYIVYSPISHCHTIALENSLPTDHIFWHKQNESFIQWCNIVVIITIDGWIESKGVSDEVDIAKKYNKEITSYIQFTSYNPLYTDNPLHGYNYLYQSTKNISLKSENIKSTEKDNC